MTTTAASADNTRRAIEVTPKNLSIQCLRGVAALFVVLYHTSLYSGWSFGASGWSNTFDGRYGLIGVAIFFTISGLLMAELIQRTDPWRFLSHRVIRIYPTYLLAVAVWLPIAGILNIRPVGLHLFSLLLVPVGQREYYLSVEWTLVFECTYYVVLFLISVIGWQRHLNRIVAIWIILIVPAPLFIGWSDKLMYPCYAIWASSANAAFIGGLLIPSLARKIHIPVGAGVFAICILMVLNPTNIVIARWAGGAVATLLVLDVMRIKASQRALIILLKLGDWSYALYLCHVPCILVVYRLWPSFFSVGAAWLSAIAMTLVVAAGFGSLDVRMYRFLKRAVDELRDQQRRRLVNVYTGIFIVASLTGLVIL